ncbi:CoA-transferase family III [Atractiella rhizophila]|nr:CoA-transferase family III [Atractiella rhizophila]
MSMNQLLRQFSLPPSALSKLSLLRPDIPALRSSFALVQCAQLSISLSALAAAEIYALRTGKQVEVVVDAEEASNEFKSEKLAIIEGLDTFEMDRLSGLYRTKNGYVRLHTNFPHHRNGLLQILGLPESADVKREDVELKVKEVEDEHTWADQVMETGLCATSLRTFEEWDRHPHCVSSKKLFDELGPIIINKIGSSAPIPFHISSNERPLDGIKVLELTRVIAGPVAGRVLAGYGADVLWVTATHLPSQPGLDYDLTRGKRPIRLDLRSPSARSTFERLLSTADVLLQSYAPKALPSLGYTRETIRKLNPSIIFASLSAWGDEGPWNERKGFDSLVQTATGFNKAEAEAFGEEGGKAWPVQAIDHASGYFLAAGIQAALLRRAREGGGYDIRCSLLATSHWIRSLGRVDPPSKEQMNHLLKEGGPKMSELRAADGRKLTFVNHAASFVEPQEGNEGKRTWSGEWTFARMGYGDDGQDEAQWLSTEKPTAY